jgi:exopolysaccharide production protein ExoY
MADQVDRETLAEVGALGRLGDGGAARTWLRDALRAVYLGGAKRGLDLALVLIAAPFLAPLLAALAALAAWDGGPALYGQARVGRGGRRFTCWKFRTMVPDAEARLAALLAADPDAAAEWARCQKLRRDPRVTRTGRWLRAASLDELPQLWNVLTGEMSLVGPRPMTPAQEPIYPGTAYYRLRPGITGFWQVSERHEGAFAGRAVHDARYADEVSLATDLTLLWRTAAVVLRGGGA